MAVRSRCDNLIQFSLPIKFVKIVKNGLNSINPQFLQWMHKQKLTKDGKSLIQFCFIQLQRTQKKICWVFRKVYYYYLWSLFSVRVFTTLWRSYLPRRLVDWVYSIYSSLMSDERGQNGRENSCTFMALRAKQCSSSVDNLLLLFLFNRFHREAEEEKTFLLSAFCDIFKRRWKFLALNSSCICTAIVAISFLVQLKSLWRDFASLNVRTAAVRLTFMIHIPSQTFEVFSCCELRKKIEARGENVIDEDCRGWEDVICAKEARFMRIKFAKSSWSILWLASKSLKHFQF